MLTPVVDVLAIGEVMMELATRAPLTQANAFDCTFAGDTFNTAVGLSRLGNTTAYLTHVGSDPFAQRLYDMLEAEGIDTRYVLGSNSYTGLYFLSNPNAQHRHCVYYRKNSAASLLSPDDVTPELIKSARVVYASGITMALSQSAYQATLKAFRLAREYGVLTAFDMNYRKELWQGQEAAFDALRQILPLTDVCMPSLHSDIEPILGLSRPDQIIEYLWCQVPEKPTIIALKAGGQGCYLGFRGQMLHVPALVVPAPVDPVGAGDAFNAGFLHGLLERRSLLDCARLATVTAGLKIQRSGTIDALPQRQAVYATAFPNQRLLANTL